MAERHPYNPITEPGPTPSPGTAAQQVGEEAARARARAEEVGRTAAELADEERRKAAESTAAAGAAMQAAAEHLARGPRMYSREDAVRIGRSIGYRLGLAMRYLRGMRTGRVRTEPTAASADTMENVKEFVREHPTALLGAAAAGFFVGRMLRGQ